MVAVVVVVQWCDGWLVGIFGILMVVGMPVE